MNESTDLSDDLSLRLAALARAELDARRIAISRELATIPPPVPACDVDFNRLLEDRGRIADDLHRLDRIVRAGGDAPAIAAFCRDADTLSDALKQRVETMLAAPRPA